LFIKNEITISLLPDITDELLQQMKVSAAGTRLKIINACKKAKDLEFAEKDNGLSHLRIKEETLPDRTLVDLERELNELREGQGFIIDGKEIEYIKLLGDGASGDVYKGLYKGAPVAIKILKEMTADQEIEEFKKEFEILSAIRHKNIVFFYGAAMQPRLCMVMEYCTRKSLHHVMKESSLVINWSKALSMCKETCMGLNALHSNKPQILHRDLKSLNLLVTQEWHIKLCDFGLSRMVNAENMATMKQMRGTFAYCDPEVYNGGTFSGASDIYSLAIIMWEIVNRIMKGKYEGPYSEFKNLTYDFQIIIQAAKEHVRPTIPKDTPQCVVDLITQCWNKSQAGRPSLSSIISTLESIEQQYSQKVTVWDALIK